MSSRYYLALRCDWCGEMNEEVMYGDDTPLFTCEHCGKPNYIVMSFDSKKYEPPQEGK